jgi:hypothetical protein
MNRNLLGIVAAILLLLGGITHFLGPGGNSASGFAGGCIRVGLVLGALWLALPQILATIARTPGWLIGWFIKKQVPPGSSITEQRPAQPPSQPVIKPPRPRRRSNG